MDWLDLRAVQATLKSLLQHCNSKASYLQTPLALGKTEMHFVLISTPQRCSALSLDHTVQVPCSHADSSALPGCLHCKFLREGSSCPSGVQASPSPSPLSRERKVGRSQAGHPHSWAGALLRKRDVGTGAQQTTLLPHLSETFAL